MFEFFIHSYSVSLQISTDLKTSEEVPLVRIEDVVMHIKGGTGGWNPFRSFDASQIMTERQNDSQCAPKGVGLVL